MALVMAALAHRQEVPGSAHHEVYRAETGQVLARRYTGSAS